MLGLVDTHNKVTMRFGRRQHGKLFRILYNMYVASVLDSFGTLYDRWLYDKHGVSFDNILPAPGEYPLLDAWCLDEYKSDQLGLVLTGDAVTVGIVHNDIIGVWCETFCWSR